MATDHLAGIIACECGGDSVSWNVRGRANKDVIWRQRRCKRCKKIFTTFESRVHPEGYSRADQAIARLQSAIRAAAHALEALLVEKSQRPPL